MSYFNFDGNCQIWDNTEAVTVILIRSGGNTSVPIDIAKRTAISKTDILVDSSLMESDSAAWNIPEVLLNPASNGRRLKRDDVIVDASGRRWRVSLVDLQHAGSRWRAACSLER